MQLLGDENDIEEAWYFWSLMQATGDSGGPRFLPYGPALKDQPKLLMDNILTISFASGRIRKSLKK